MRKRLYEIISASNGNDKLSSVYDIFMMAVIIISLVPLVFKQSFEAFDIMDKICVSIFIIDYILRWITADYKFQNHSATAYLRYPFSVMAIIDLVSILPSLTVLNQGFKLLRLLRLFRALRVFRAFKLFRYSKNARIIMNIFKRQKGPLSYVLILAVGYIVISALIIFNVEPDSFNSFFDAIYWATVSLTTMGYGDIYPVTEIGRIVTMVSSLFGIAIVALPAGIITAGYMDEIKNIAETKDEDPNIK
ncbi:MAG: ion transporter [Clostridia bacterium]|nr:ion transporter [Clostridia bacterium]